MKSTAIRHNANLFKCLCVAMFISGCVSGPKVPKVYSHDALVTPKLTPSTQKYGSNIAIFFEPADSTYIHKQAFSNSISATKIGEGSKKVLNAAIEQTFENVSEIDALPPFDISSVDVDGIVEPRLDYLSMRSGFESSDTKFHTTYIFLFYTNEGIPISSWKIADYEGGYYAEQLNNIAQKFINDFHNAEETKPFREYLETKRKDVLGFKSEEIAVDADIVKDESTAKLIDAGILPVHLSLKNQSHNDLVFSGLDARLIVPGHGHLVTAFPGSVVSAMAYNKALSATDPTDVGAFFGTIGLIGSMSSSAHSQSDLRKKETDFFEGKRLGEQKIGPGGLLEGFLYFVIPENIQILSEASISFWLAEPTSANGIRKETKLLGIGYEKKSNQMEATVKPSVAVPVIQETDSKVPGNSVENPLTGTYSSTYSGKDLKKSPDFRNNNFQVRLEQDGKKISGTFGIRGKVWGDLVDEETIKFELFATGGFSRKGNWKINPDNNSLEGEISSNKEEVWNLIKIQ